MVWQGTLSAKQNRRGKTRRFPMTKIDQPGDTGLEAEDRLYAAYKELMQDELREALAKASEPIEEVRLHARFALKPRAEFMRQFERMQTADKEAFAERLLLGSEGRRARIARLAQEGLALLERLAASRTDEGPQVGPSRR